LKNKISKTITNLAENPKNPILKTHKVTTKVHGEVFSSSVTGDIRIIWLISDDKKITILLVDIGGHSGFDRVYD
jgi:mRNA-degrading endonuclease YafQ of YafQ-DinJ toxin-antitoxin module